MRSCESELPEPAPRHTVQLRRGTLPFAIEDRLAELSFGSGTRPLGGYFYRSAADWTEAADAIITWWERAYERARRDGFVGLPREAWLEERAGLRKLICWRDARKGLLASQRSMVVDRPQQADRLRPYLARIGRRYVDWMRRAGHDEVRLWAWGCRVILNKNKGDPTFAPGGWRSVGVSLAALFPIGMPGHKFLELAAELRSPQLRRFTYGVTLPTVRLQGSANVGDVWGVSRGALRVVGSGRVVRDRKIQIIPWHENRIMAMPVAVMFKCCKTFAPWLTGNVAVAKRQHDAGPWNLSTDMKNYDDSLGWQLLDCWAVCCLKPVCDELERMSVVPAGFAELCVYLFRTSYRKHSIFPPLLVGSAARAELKLGGMPSGVQATNRADGDCNEADIAERNDRGAGVEEFSLTGDDRKLRFATKRQRSRWLSTGHSDLVEEEALADCIVRTHLSTPVGGPTPMELARAMMFTLDREPMNETWQTAAVADGVRTRRRLLTGHPGAWAYDEWLASTEAGRMALAASRMPPSFGPGWMATAVGARAMGDSYESDPASWAAIVREQSRDAVWDKESGLPSEPRMIDLEAAGRRLGADAALEVVTRVGKGRKDTYERREQERRRHKVRK